MDLSSEFGAETVAEEPLKIFYSWQSWTPGARNRAFIEDALDQVLEQVNEVYGKPLIIDRNTKNLPGAPAIADAILEKIEQCAVFLADVTLVIRDEEHASPNPNVMLELGYAVKCLGWDRIILVMNKAFGSPEQLPFDLRHRRWPLSYELVSGQEKGHERAQLAGGIKGAIEMILHRGLPAEGESVTERVERLISQGEVIPLDRVMHDQIEQGYQKTRSDLVYEERQKLLAGYGEKRREIWTAGLEFYFRKCQPELEAFVPLCWYGQADQAKYIARAIKRWMEAKANDPQPKMAWRYAPSLFLTYVAGIAAVGNENWAYMARAAG